MLSIHHISFVLISTCGGCRFGVFI
jgi:predicted nucleotide-binding protein (sugar kinase/HSP70/actin superfamily)